MKELHQSVAHTAKEIIIKENSSYRVRLEKHEVVAPKGLFNIDIVQESLKDGRVEGKQTYNFFMTKEELQILADGLTA